MSEVEENVVAHVRVWATETYVSVGYERSGIPIATLVLKRDVAAVGLRKLDELDFEGGDPARVAMLNELADMMREVLKGNGVDGQIMPLTGNDDSWLGQLLREPS